MSHRIDDDEVVKGPPSATCGGWGLPVRGVRAGDVSKQLEVDDATAAEALDLFYALAEALIKNVERTNRCQQPSSTRE